MHKTNEQLEKLFLSPTSMFVFHSSFCSHPSSDFVCKVAYLIFCVVLAFGSLNWTWWVLIGGKLTDGETWEYMLAATRKQVCFNPCLERLSFRQNIPVQVYGWEVSYPVFHALTMFSHETIQERANSSSPASASKTSRWHCCCMWWHPNDCFKESPLKRIEARKYLLLKFNLNTIKLEMLLVMVVTGYFPGKLLACREL